MEQEKQRLWAAAIAATLRAERGVADLSEAELARRTGISRTSYRKYESAERMPNAVQLATIAEAFGITMTHLVSEASRRAEG